MGKISLLNPDRLIEFKVGEYTIRRKKLSYGPTIQDKSGQIKIHYSVTLQDKIVNSFLSARLARKWCSQHVR